MTELSPSAQQLVRVGRSAGRPTDADRERIRAAVQALLGAAALVGESAAPPAPPAPSGAARFGWVKASALAVGIGVLAGGLFLALRSPPVTHGAPFAPPRVSAAAASEPAPSTPTTVASSAALDGEGAAPTPVKARAVEAPALSTSRSSEHLAEEVALLSRATADLRAGRAGDALDALDEHRRKFPGGVLAEERRAARAQALCALGRRSEAEVELAHLARTAPQSPQGARARQFCNGMR